MKILLTVILSTTIGSISAYASNERTTSHILTTFFRTSRAIIAGNKELIGSPTKAAGSNKKAFVDNFLKRAKKNYRRLNGASYPKNDPNANHLETAIRKIMTKAVNGEYEKEFKYSKEGYFKDGVKDYDNKFLPARFAVEVMKEFSTLTGGKVTLKLTAPPKYLVKKSNAPDDWEKSAIKKYESGAIGKNVDHAETINEGGKRFYRKLLPEIYNQKCIGCHGSAPGQNGPNIHASGVGGKIGDVGGFISVSIQLGN